MQKPYLDERRQALEEEYFFKLNRKLLDRLRAAEALGAINGHHIAGSSDLVEDARVDRDAEVRSQAGR
jgi:hypothetical protein